LGDLKISNSTFSNNKSGGVAGAIRFDEGHVRLSHCSFNGNSAEGNTGSGGAVRMYDVLSCEVTHSDFIANTSGSRSGALYIRGFDNSGNPTSISHCYFHKNVSENQSSAIFVSRANPFEMTHCTLLENSNTSKTSTKSTLVYQSIHGTIEKCTFYNNEAPSIAGVNSGDTLFIKNSTLVNDNGDSNPVIREGSGMRMVISSSVVATTATIASGMGGFMGVKTSGGNNVFSFVFYNGPSSDQHSLPFSSVMMDSVLSQNEIGLPVLLPLPSSPVIDNGDSTDFSTAQNSPIFNYRDAGAAEFKVHSYDTVFECDGYYWRNSFYDSTGVYLDTLLTPSGTLDSVAFLFLDVVGIDTTTYLNGFDLYSNEQRDSAVYQWFVCDLDTLIPIVGADDYKLTLDSNGTYAVRIELEGCVDTSDCVYFGNVSLNEYSESPLVTLYPNPTTGWIHVNSPDPVLSLSLFSLEGKELLHSTNKNSLDGGELIPGMYILRIELRDHRMHSEKVIIKR
jgi:hypothetical protein